MNFNCCSIFNGFKIINDLKFLLECSKVLQDHKCSVTCLTNDPHTNPWKYVLSSPSITSSFERSRYTFKIQDLTGLWFRNPQKSCKLVHNLSNHPFHASKFRKVVHDWSNFTLQSTSSSCTDYITSDDFSKLEIVYWIMLWSPSCWLASSTFLSPFCLLTALKTNKLVKILILCLRRTSKLFFNRIKCWNKIKIFKYDYFRWFHAF